MRNIVVTTIALLAAISGIETSAKVPEWYPLGIVFPFQWHERHCAGYAGAYDNARIAPVQTSGSLKAGIPKVITIGAVDPLRMCDQFLNPLALIVRAYPSTVSLKVYGPGNLCARIPRVHSGVPWGIFTALAVTDHYAGCSDDIGEGGEYTIVVTSQRNVNATVQVEIDWDGSYEKIPWQYRQGPNAFTESLMP